MCVFAFYIKIIISFYIRKINLSIWQILLCAFVPFVQQRADRPTVSAPKKRGKRIVSKKRIFLLFFHFFG